MDANKQKAWAATPNQAASGEILLLRKNKSKNTAKGSANRELMMRLFEISNVSK